VKAAGTVCVPPTHLTTIRYKAVAVAKVGLAGIDGACAVGIQGGLGHIQGGQEGTGVLAVLYTGEVPPASATCEADTDTKKQTWKQIQEGAGVLAVLYTGAGATSR
jgi:hypothetical protein